MGAFAAFIPAGIVLLDDGLPLAASSSRSSKKSGD
jgi:hypothetical protein